MGPGVASRRRPLSYRFKTCPAAQQGEAGKTRCEPITLVSSFQCRYRTTVPISLARSGVVVLKLLTARASKRKKEPDQISAAVLR